MGVIVLLELFSEEFREKTKLVINPYGGGGTAEKIVAVLKEVSLEGILNKSFHDIEVESGSEQ